MKTKNMLKLMLCAAIFTPELMLSSLTQNTLVLTPNGYTAIEKLTIHDPVTTPFNNFANIQALNVSFKNTVYEITTINEIFSVSEDQLLYEPNLNAWVEAKNITTDNFLIDSDNEKIKCLSVRKINTEAPCYAISLNFPHAFYITKSNILAHNIAPAAIFIPAAYSGASYIATTCTAIISLGILGGFFHKKSNKNNFSSSNNSSPQNSPSNDPQKNKPEKAANMHQVFKYFKIGATLKKASEKTKFHVQGQTVWRATKNIIELGIQKGDFFYLDNLHKDHIEVFKSVGEKLIRTVLNLDGTVNIPKLTKALNEFRSIAKYLRT